MTKKIKNAIINKRGYTLWQTGDSHVLKIFKIFAIKNNLPIIKRKWDNIDLNFLSQKEKFQSKIPEIKKCLGLDIVLIKSAKS